MLLGLYTGNISESSVQYFTPDPVRRIATLDLQARKMKFLFKKWLVSILKEVGILKLDILSGL